jgi:uncharacterized protein YbcV (DUF1398 family)
MNGSQHNDFAVYIQELITLGIKGYETFVHDGHIEYFGTDDFRAIATDTYKNINIGPTANKERFIEFLAIHQDGQTDYLTFCNHAAQCGIARWSISITEMTCTYFDLSGNAIVIEKI